MTQNQPDRLNRIEAILLQVAQILQRRTNGSNSLHHISDDLVVVRQLLISSDACTLYTKRKINQLTQKVDRVAFRFTTLITRRSELSEQQRQQLTIGSNLI